MAVTFDAFFVRRTVGPGLTHVIARAAAPRTSVAGVAVAILVAVTPEPAVSSLAPLARAALDVGSADRCPGANAVAAPPSARTIVVVGALARAGIAGRGTVESDGPAIARGVDGELRAGAREGQCGAQKTTQGRGARDVAARHGSERTPAAAALRGRRRPPRKGTALGTQPRSRYVAPP